jgi:hypothetical protein
MEKESAQVSSVSSGYETQQSGIAIQRKDQQFGTVLVGTGL